MPISRSRAATLAAALLPALGVAAPLTLDQALELALQRSAATRAGQAGTLSATETARAAGQLPDPMLKVGVDNLPVTGADRFSTTRDSMTMKRVGVSQEWLSSDKREARQASAQAQADREATMARVAGGEARLQTALAYIDAYCAAQALALSNVAEHHLHEELAAAKARLASASASGHEVLALTSARGLAEDESAEVRQAQNAAHVALLRWVGVSSDELAPPVMVPVAQSEFVGNHPIVLAAQRDVDLARREATVAQTNRQPNWTWEVSYGQRTGYSDMVSFGVSIPLPIAASQRQDRETAARLALVDKGEAALAEATRAATAEYQTLTSDGQRLSERIERYRAAVVLPAQQRTAAALAGYRSNQNPLMALFEARHAEVEAQRKLLALQKELARTQAQLAFKPVVAGVAR